MRGPGTERKPDSPRSGQNRNIFHLIGLASQALCRNGREDQAREMQDRITSGRCRSYSEALGIIGEYVNITPEKNMETGGMTQ